MAPLEGPVGVGALIDAILLGCAIAQSCVYYKNSRASMWLLTVLVSLNLLLLTAHLGCTAAWLWENEQASAGDASAASRSLIFFGVSEILSAVILFSVRCFFTYRIMKLTKNHLLALLFFVICIISFTAALGAASGFFANTTTNIIVGLVGNWIFPFSLISGQLCDLATSVTLWFRLRSHKGVTDVKGRCGRLSLLKIESGSIANSFDATAAMFFMFTKASFAWVALVVAMPGVFVNTLLLALVAGAGLCGDIEHRRTFDDKLINPEANNSQITIKISQDEDKRLGSSFV